MPFSDAVKLEAKQRSNFRCVVCHQPSVEVHHMTPQSEGGPDTIDNDAPLCGFCHGQPGGNPELRKQLREMRDSWWTRCTEERQKAADAGLAQRLDTLHVA
jgi:hypothetical protein